MIFSYCHISQRFATNWTNVVTASVRLTQWKREWFSINSSTKDCFLRRNTTQGKRKKNHIRKGDLEASWMHEMPTRKSTYNCTWWKHVITADRTICFQTFLPALVISQFHGQTTITCHAMKEVHTKSLPNSAQIARWAMINSPEGTSGVKILKINVNKS